MVALPADPPLSYGTDLTIARKVRRVQLGDGYSVRSRMGVNHSRQSWRLSWEQISDAEEETLRDFFDARGDVDVIDWTPPNQSVALKFSASGYNATPVSYNNWTVTVNIMQEFDV